LGVVSIRSIMLPSCHAWLTGSMTPHFETSL
jgi:hypothetical protein